MKKRLLVVNIILYALLYSISCFGVGFHYGDRWNSVNPPMIITTIFPVLGLVLLAFGIYFLCNRNKITPTGYSFMAGFTLVHIPLADVIVAVDNYMRHRHFDISLWDHFSLYWWAYIPATVICINYIICAVLTNREYKEIRRKRREAAS